MSASKYAGGSTSGSEGGSNISRYPSGKGDGACNKMMSSGELSPVSAYPGGIKGDASKVTPTRLIQGKPEFALSSSELSPKSTAGGTSGGKTVQTFRQETKKTIYDS